MFLNYKMNYISLKKGYSNHTIKLKLYNNSTSFLNFLNISVIPYIYRASLITKPIYIMFRHTQNNKHIKSRINFLLI